MDLYEVQGARRRDGKQVTRRIHAKNVKRAEAQAIASGILVSQIDRLDQDKAIAAGSMAISIAAGVVGAWAIISLALGVAAFIYGLPEEMPQLVWGIGLGMLFFVLRAIARLIKRAAVTTRERCRLSS